MKPPTLCASCRPMTICVLSDMCVLRVYSGPASLEYASAPAGVLRRGGKNPRSFGPYEVKHAARQATCAD
eukprot:scaffold343027_cov19-Prasinocladus_malaysianus.AAC.1